MSTRIGRLPHLLAAAPLICLLGACGCGEEKPVPVEGGADTLASVAYDWSRDDRLVEFLHPCPELGHFNGDTSNMLPVLARKLRNSQRTVLRNVREELAAGGPPAIEELGRLVRRLYTDPHGSHAVQNALGVFRMSDHGGIPEALAVLETCLGHPQEIVRTAAVRALTEHSAPELYGKLKSLVPITPAQMYKSLWKAMHRADPVRFEEDLAAWIDAGTYRGQWAHGARLVASGATTSTGDRLAVATTTVTDPEVRAFLFAALSRRDGESALEPLLAMLEDEKPQVRMIGLSALAFTDSIQPMVEVLRNDDHSGLRQVAASQLASHAGERSVRDALFTGISDPDADTRQACLTALLATGDEATADYALTLLDGGRGELEAVLHALAGHWSANPGLADRARALLERRLADLEGEPLKRKGPVLQALGSVPGAATARLLLGVADAVADEEIHQLSGFRWVSMQASNSGPEGREVLMAAWREEEDLVRRMDLLWPATSAHDDSTREFLIEVLLAERSAPHERLYVAERLACEGSATEVAPLLKRAARRMNDRVFRPAMECLLWRWYG